MKTRPITRKERRIALRFYWLILPVAGIAGLIITVLIKFDSLPLPARLAGSLIIGGVVVVFTFKWWQLYRDLKEGEVTEVIGILTRKVKLGSSKVGHPSSGIGRGSRSRPNSPTFILEMNGGRYEVKAKHFGKVKEGQEIQLDMLEKSMLVLDVYPLKKEIN